MTSSILPPLTVVGLVGLAALSGCSTSDAPAAWTPSPTPTTSASSTGSPGPGTATASAGSPAGTAPAGATGVPGLLSHPKVLWTGDYLKPVGTAVVGVDETFTGRDPATGAVRWSYRLTDPAGMSSSMGGELQVIGTRMMLRQGVQPTGQSPTGPHARARTTILDPATGRLVKQLVLDEKPAARDPETGVLRLEEAGVGDGIAVPMRSGKVDVIHATGAVEELPGLAAGDVYVPRGSGYGARSAYLKAVGAPPMTAAQQVYVTPQRRILRATPTQPGAGEPAYTYELATSDWKPVAPATTCPASAGAVQRGRQVLASPQGRTAVHAGAVIDLTTGAVRCVAVPGVTDPRLTAPGDDGSAWVQDQGRAGLLAPGAVTTELVPVANEQAVPAATLPQGRYLLGGDQGFSVVTMP